MPVSSALYSIGHGQKTQEELLLGLKSFDIHFPVGVRTGPYSKWNPQFNQGDDWELVTARKNQIIFIWEITLEGVP